MPRPKKKKTPKKAKKKAVRRSGKPVKKSVKKSVRKRVPKKSARKKTPEKTAALKNTAELQKYFDVLELGAEATIADIIKAYLRLRDLYGTDTIAILPLGDEFSDADREKMRNRITEAYRKLMAQSRDFC